MMDEITKAQTRQYLYDLHVDDVSQKQHILRAAMASGYGLDAASFTRPFPGSTTITNVTKEAKSPLAAIAGGGLAALLTGGAIAAAGALWPESTGPSVAQPAAAATEPAELRVKWWIEDDETGGSVEQLPAEQTAP